jgi:hypothetical protein
MEYARSYRNAIGNAIGNDGNVAVAEGRAAGSWRRLSGRLNMMGYYVPPACATSGGSIVFGTHGGRRLADSLLETLHTTMSASNQQGKQSPERQIVDETGTAWRVTEVRVWDANGKQANSLIAAHERGFRRLWHFPENWADLADLQLAELVSKPVRKAAQ